MANTSLPNLTERTATADTDLIHVNSGGTDYKETKANFLSGVKLNYYDDVALSSMTIGSNGYIQLTKPNAVWGKNIVSASILDWSSATGAFCFCIKDSSSATYYIIGAPSTVINGLKLRWWYQ